MEKKPLEILTPEELGLSSSSISLFLQQLKQKQVCMHGFLVVRYGKIAAEGYWKPFHKDQKHRMFSISKSFVSVAIGLMESEGLISISDSIASYFPEKWPDCGLHPYIQKATIRNLLMMASPHQITTYKIVQDDDWVRTFFTCQPTHLPGTIFSYDTSATTVLCALVEKLTKKTLLGYLYEKALCHIGFSEDAYCLELPLGGSSGGSGVMCTPRDLAKFAQLCMKNGLHEGKQRLPKKYMQEATARQIDNSNGMGFDFANRKGYGYQFWRCKNNSFVLFGMGGQLAVCIPHKDLMLITTADTQNMAGGESIILNTFWDTIYASASESPLAQNKNALQELQKQVDSLAMHMQTEMGQTEQFDSTLAQKASGQTYTMNKNPMGISSVRVSISNEACQFCFTNDNGEHQILAGLKEPIAQPFPHNHFRCISSAAWVDKNTIMITTNVIDDNLGTLKITICFGEETITIAMYNWAENFLKPYSGFASGVKVSSNGCL